MPGFAFRLVAVVARAAHLLPLPGIRHVDVFLLRGLGRIARASLALLCGLKGAGELRQAQVRSLGYRPVPPRARPKNLSPKGASSDRSDLLLPPPRTAPRLDGRFADPMPAIAAPPSGPFGEMVPPTNRTARYLKKRTMGRLDVCSPAQ